MTTFKNDELRILHGNQFRNLTIGFPSQFFKPEKRSLKLRQLGAGEPRMNTDGHGWG
jgi:hypothetical protein